MSVDRPTRMVIRDVAIIDATGREPEGRHDVLVEDGRIHSIGSPGNLPTDVATVDGAGCTLLPGLTDAHVHFALIGQKGDHGSDPWIMHVLAVSRTCTLLPGQPLDDIALLAEPDNVTLVMCAGVVAKDREGRLG